MPPLSESRIPVECHGVLLTEIKLRCKAKGSKAVSFAWSRAPTVSTVDPRQSLPPVWSHEPYFINHGEKTYLGLRPLDRAFEDLLSGYEQRYKEPGSDLSAIRYTYAGGPPMAKADVSHFVCEDVRRASSGQGMSSQLRFCPIPVARVQEIEFKFTQSPVDLDQPSWVTQGLDGALYAPFLGPASVQTVQDHVLDDQSHVPIKRSTDAGVSFPQIDGTADAVLEMWSAQNFAWERVTSCRYADLADPAISTGWFSKMWTVEHEGSMKCLTGPQVSRAQWAGIISQYLPRNFDPRYAELTSNRFGSSKSKETKNMTSACESIQRNLQPTTNVYDEGDNDLRVISLRSKHFSGQEEVCFRLRLDATSLLAGQSYQTPTGADWWWTG